LRPFDIQELVTKRIAVNYAPGANPDALIECFGSHYDPEDLELLQTFMGTCLNATTRDRLLLYLQGPSACGKTTLMKAVSRLMGAYSSQVDVDLFTVDRKGKDVEGELARVAGKRFAFAPECSHKKTLDEARIKWLTGADDCRYRKLYEAASTCPATAKFAIYGNSKPNVDGGRDGALWRRIVLIKAKSGAKEEEEKPELQENACNDPKELQGLLNWMLAGHAKWVSDGMRIILTDRAKTVRESYRQEQDSIGDFLEECCNRGVLEKERQPGLYRAFKDWAEKQGIRFIPSSKSFASIMRDEFEEGKIHGAKVWKGIGLITSKRHPDD
jgi:putative DNA primase/helicase